MSKVKINKNDSNRVLLSELLPYEVPMLFSNEGLYNIITQKKHQYFFKKIRDKKDAKDFGIPFTYEITKSGESDSRKLSIIHPLNQYDFIEFYKKYESIILHLCSRSPFSLRHAASVAKYYFSPEMVFDEDEMKNPGAEIQPDILNTETKIYKSYFTYHPIDLIYKFYERNEYQRLEQKFNHLLEFDISKCFYNIYTHSICWAVKGKVQGKLNKGKETFENRFDELMQKANFNETNGIVVGSEVSRIFAEIILQQVDLNVIQAIEDDHKKGRTKIKIGIDFDIRRYVDDYFVFSNDEKVGEYILKLYKRKLDDYKLYINSAKTEKKSSPFITNIAVGKRELKKVMDSLFSGIIEESKDGEKVVKAIKIKNAYSLSQSFIKDFQCIVKSNNLTYDVLNKEVIRNFKRMLIKFLKDELITKNKEGWSTFLLFYLDVIFYAYSLHINSSGTYKIAQSIVLIEKFANQHDRDFKHVVFSKIAKEADFAMGIYHRKSKANETNVDTLNLLIALKKLGKDFLLTERKIRELFEFEEGKSSEGYNKINYFQIITLLYYYGNFDNFKILRAELIKVITNKMRMEVDPFSKAEFTCLFFDLICCPYITDDIKRKLLRVTKYMPHDALESDLNDEISKISASKMWFMNWDEEIDLEAVLKKKEFVSTY